MIAGKLLFDFYLVILITGNLLFDFYFMYFVILTGSLLQRNLTQFLRAVLSNLLLDNFFQGSTVRTAVFHATCRIHCWLYLSVFLTNLLICLVCVSSMNKSEKSKPFQWYHICLVHKNPVTSSYRVCPFGLSVETVHAL